jgi:type I restriction enzyme, S subunit
MSLDGPSIGTTHGLWGLPDGWTWARLSEVSEIIAGQSPPSETYNSTGVGLPFFQGKAEFGSLNPTPRKWCDRPSKIAEPDDVLISVRAPVGPTNLALERCGIGRGLAAIRPGSATSADWLLHYFRFSEKRIAGKGTGTTFAAITAPVLAAQEVPLAPLPEQRRIVARIDELFAEIAEGEAALGAVRQDLETWRRALLKAAVTGELTRDWREANRPTETGADLLARIRAERTSPAQKSRRRSARAAVEVLDASLTPLPEGWVWTTWQEVGVSQNGRAFPSSEYTTDGIKLLRPGNLYADGSVGWNERNSRYLPTKFLEMATDLLIEGSELVINLTAQSLKDEFLGRVCLTSRGERCLLNQRLARLTPFSIPRKFMLIVFKSPLFRSFVQNLNSGSLIQHMFTSQMDRFYFPLPPAAEQEVIVERVEDGLAALSETAQSIDAQLQTTNLFRQSILKAAFEGRLVPQDPTDEPASVLLARLRDRYPSNGARRRRTRAASDVSHSSLPGLIGQSSHPRVGPAGND